jgi:hypothetical protein
MYDRARQLGVPFGAQDRASPHFMGLASFGLGIGIFCDLRYSVLLLNAILELYFLGLALSRPQVPLQSGSSLPFTWRKPYLEHPIGTAMEEAVVVGYSSHGP